MWTKPYKYKEGFAIGLGIFAVGEMLQLTLGRIDWNMFTWPINSIVLAVYLLMLVVSFLLRKKIYFVEWTMTLWSAIPAMMFSVLYTLYFGLTNWTDMLGYWPFVLSYLWMLNCIGLICIRRIMMLANGSRTVKDKLAKDIPFLLNHLGLFISLLTGTLGNADMERYEMTTIIGQPENKAVFSDISEAIKKGKPYVEMPFSIELQKFVMEEYPVTDESQIPEPKRFASEVVVHRDNGSTFDAVVEVNKPLKVDGWKIYQYSYDIAMGKLSEISILQLVRDPWLPYVYLGIYMMLIGAVCLFIIPRK